MPIITFWSNNEKAIGQSVSAAATATVMAMEHNYKVLLMSADFDNDTIESCFGAQESNKEIVKTLVRRPQINLDSGINGLIKLADSNRVTPDVIQDYTKIIFKNRLEVLYSPVDSNGRNFMPEFKNILQNASRYYDYVFVDLRKGYKYKEQLEILEMSDVVVLNIEQGIKSILNFFNMTDLQIIGNKVVWNICRYDSKSKFNSKNLIRNILKKQYVFETHYNTLVSDAVQEGNLVELLIRFKTLKDEDENKEFVAKIEEMIQGILIKHEETRRRM